MLTDKQKKLLQLNEEVLEKERIAAKRSEIESRVEREQRWRRLVHDAVVELSEEVRDEKTVEAALPYLDSLSWDEMVEERYISRFCGLPLCDGNVVHVVQQRYHIDRKTKKIYETCKERSKFCSSACFHRSASIRSQLSTEPLWMTGESAARMKKKYTLEVCEEVSKSVEKPAKIVEIVEDKMDKLVTRMHSLKVAERDESTEEDSHDEEERAEMRKIKKDDDDFVNSVKRFIGQRTTAGTTSAETDKDKEGRMEDSESAPQTQRQDITPVSQTAASRLPERQQSNPKNLKLSESENQKLDRLRKKFSRSATGKAPLIIEPPKLSSKLLRETKTAERVVRTTELLDFDGERVAVPDEREGDTVSPQPEVLSSDEAPPSANDEGLLEYVRTLLGNWWSERTRDVVLMGGRRPNTEMDRLLRRFMAGDRADELDMLDDVTLPEVDSVDISKRRLEILVTSLRPSWRAMEHHLGVRSSRSSLLTQMISTFHLASDSVTGFDKRQLRLIVIVLWRLVCRMSDELDDSFFPGGFASPEVHSYLQWADIHESTFASLNKMITERLD